MTAHAVTPSYLLKLFRGGKDRKSLDTFDIGNLNEVCAAFPTLYHEEREAMVCKLINLAREEEQAIRRADIAKRTAHA